MILYLTTQERINLLDFLGREENYAVKKMAGSFSLKRFVMHDMRNFTHFTELFLDRKAFIDSDEEFVAALDEFRCMYEARISIICEGLSANDFLMKALIEKGIGNIVTGSSYDRVKEEIAECLSDAGMTKHLPASGAEEADFAENYKFNANGIKIAVSGTQNRIGTTTAAIGLTNWLAHVGASVCYIEANSSGCLKYMGSAFEMKRQESGYIYENAVYLEEENTAEMGQFQFLIFDFGAKIPEEDYDSYVFVCGAKPYELPHTLKAVEEMSKISREYILLFSFTDKEYRELMNTLFRGKNSILFLENQQNCFDYTKNRKMYFNVVKKYAVKL